MIGREGPVDYFELVRWARRQAREHDLVAVEAHVLLLLATYANDEAVAWPTIATLADDAGVARRGRHSATVSRALARLEELQLVWSEYGGNGQAARRHLLFDPAREGRVVPLLPRVSPVRPEEPLETIFVKNQKQRSHP